ncbi:MAG: nickel pincer cofactor biosynthesis protein LarC [Candidatus Omnitrophota bacterium]
MKIAYLDCFSGISGDMTIGAFLDAGLSLKVLTRELAKLKLKGYKLRTRKVTRGVIAGTKFDCISAGTGHGHHSLRSINVLIDRSALKYRVKETAKEIFRAIAAAEMKVHGKLKPGDVIFHELGDIDSIVDIVGAAIAIDELGIDAVYSSGVNMGRSIAATRHGNIPVPSPASLELLKGFPVSILEIGAELVTPTGAGILKVLSKAAGAVPQMEISAIGYGAGSKEIGERPNLLRVLIGVAESPFKEDNVYVAETNVDDMNPQHVGYTIDKLLGAGALDAYVTNIQMKKSRPAFKLTAITDPAKLQRIAHIIFTETPAIGLRFFSAGRMKLDRSLKTVRTAYGKVSVKVSKGPGGLLTVSPEHDECVRAAGKRKVPLRKVYEAAKFAARSALMLIIAGAFLSSWSLVFADTVITSNGEEIKGIVLEDYKDRMILSTASGERTIMKSDIKELYYDEEVDNLVKLAEQAKERRDYIRALTYYDMAFKVNPNSKAAKDGLVFLEGYLFRKEQAQKEDDVRKREDLERLQRTAAIEPPKVEEVPEKAARLKKAIGITFEIAGGFPCVANVQRNSPAEDAGIKAGDRLVAIWARLTGYMELKDLLDAFLDKPSLELKCTIERTVYIRLPPLKLVAPGAGELIGASLAMEFDGLTVSSVRANGAAAEAGLKKGDLVTFINGKQTRYMPLNKAISLIRRSKGDTVEFVLRREVLMWRRS